MLSTQSSQVSPFYYFANSQHNTSPILDRSPMQMMLKNIYTVTAPVWFDLTHNVVLHGEDFKLLSLSVKVRSNCCFFRWIISSHKPCVNRRKYEWLKLAQTIPYRIYNP